jgi:hypothetical protein
MKCKKALPKSALSAFVENFVGTKFDGRNGALEMGISTQRRRPAVRLTFSLPVDRIRKTNGLVGACFPLLRYHRCWQFE